MLDVHRLRRLSRAEKRSCCEDFSAKQRRRAGLPVPNRYRHCTKTGRDPRPSGCRGFCEPTQQQNLPCYSSFSVDQRAWAAFLAISCLLSGVNLAARALPPFLPPNRPNATAAGFLPSARNLSSLDRSSTASATMEAASLLRSLGFLLERISTVYHTYFVRLLFAKSPK